jgi:probable rRNA maturation factor
MDFPIFPSDEMDAQAQGVYFDYEDTDFELENQEQLTTWIEKVIADEGKTLGELSYVFCSDNFLHQINVEYLDHDTLTDIITFPLSEIEHQIDGELYISVERVADNAKDLGNNFIDELHRVIIHGVLHLCGYGDETDEEEALMRQKEDEALQKRA